MRKKIIGLLKQYLPVYLFFVGVYTLTGRTGKLCTESAEKRLYYARIERIKKQKKIVVDLRFGGIGDCLAYSTLPRLLQEQYGVEFYLSRASMSVFRHKDIYKLCFEMNPYFKGVSDDGDVFFAQSFESERSFWNFITDKGGESVIERLERQFGLENGQGKPELYYKPKKLNEYKNVILIDTNTISGKKFGWKFKPRAFEIEAKKYLTEGDRIEYIDPSRQDLFTYTDMIYSCKRFVGTFSGGASIAACFNKPFSVIWPVNGKNSSNYQFRYTKSAGQYVG